jgi:hypothetical protein
MLQLLIAAAVVAVGSVLGAVLRRRRVADAPTQPRLEIPAQLDRADFPNISAPWLVAIFSSASCTACADVLHKAAVLQTTEVAVVEVEFSAARALHSKYSIDAVPLVAIADEHGVVHRGFAGPMSATDLWAAVAEVRDRVADGLSRPTGSPDQWHCDPATPE